MIYTPKPGGSKCPAHSANLTLSVGERSAKDSPEERTKTTPKREGTSVV